MNKPRTYLSRRCSSWYNSVKIGLQGVPNRLLWEPVNHIHSTRKIHLRYHDLLKQVRENSLSLPSEVNDSIAILREKTEEQKLQLEHLQTIREIYKRSVQRLFDLLLITIVGVILIPLAYLALNQEPTVTVRLHIYSETVNLHGVSAAWSMNGAEESDEIIYTDKSITVTNADTIEHNNQNFTLADESGFKLTSIEKNRLPGQLNLSSLSFGDSAARFSFEVRNSVLTLSVGTDGQPITIRGVLCRNGCLGNLIRGSDTTILDPYKPATFYLKAEGKKRMEMEFAKTFPEHHSPPIDPLHFKWEDIPLQDSITFTRPLSETSNASTIESGWLYILETDDTIRLGKHDFLYIKPANKSLASVSVLGNRIGPKASEKMMLFTESIGKVSYLRTGPKELMTDQMPRRIQVLAEQKDTSLLIALLGLVATLFIPIFFRNRL